MTAPRFISSPAFQSACVELLSLMRAGQGESRAAGLARERMRLAAIARAQAKAQRVANALLDRLMTKGAVS